MNAEPLQAEPGSYRDRSGRVFYRSDRVLRVLSADGLASWRSVLGSGALDGLVRDHRLWPVGPLQEPAPPGAPAWAVAAFEQPRLPLVSYPYEWCFAALRAAALCQIELHLAALDRGLTLSDATAFNVQFDGAEARFIDPLSLRPYVDGELWAAHRQFVAEFLGPLLLRAIRGVPHNAVFRGHMNGGIDDGLLAALLPLRSWLQPAALLHVLLPDWLQRRSRAATTERLALAGRKRLPRSALLAMLNGLHRTLLRLRPKDRGAANWGRYTLERLYGDAALREKALFVERFTQAARPALLIDLGCNTGEFSALALAGGAARVVGLDADHAALDQAFERAAVQALPFTPLFQDAMDPSPAQGFAGRERSSLQQRLGGADALLALAVLHHLCIARNLPLDRAVRWLLSLAPRGVIEFVPKSDPTVRKMLALRQDIFTDYDEAAFLALIGRDAAIVEQRRLPDSERLLLWYDRRAP